MRRPQKFSPLRSILVAKLAVLSIVAIATADPTTQPAEPSNPTIKNTTEPGPNSVNQNLTESTARPAGILKYGPVSIFDSALEPVYSSLDQIGLKVGLAYTAVYQLASGGPGQRDAAGQDVDLFGNWRLLGPQDSPHNGYLYYAVEYRSDMGTGIPPASLDTQIGSLWGTTNGFNEEPVVLKEFYWEQHLGDDRLIARAGKLDPENYYNSNYWQSDSKFFLNQAFSSFPVRAFPGNGLGLNLTTKLTDQWYVSAGFQDAQGKKTTAGFDTFFQDGNLFSALEVGYTPTFKNLGHGNYRLTAWYRDAGATDGKPHDAGIDLSIDQHVNEHLVPFFRYGAGEGNINGIQQMISTGIGWEGKLITQSDVAGIAGSWGQPSNHGLSDQYAAETFYRLQVSPDNQFTVGYQLIVDPTFDPQEHLVGVFELRWRITI